ncbi:uroporphyrinogen-III C-methyltransferase [Bacillus sp. FJAT-45037]|uniref:uroporphyrinogen-III C-methyltransferase n=1 Tax=Bacillus sp. FJAT-45037 TaxID=2011007 RepID=UPI000C24CDCA|nr:uroporphyrinogen-III C-methyltransferase [Bacillus sp. FJAT-45037]
MLTKGYVYLVGAGPGDIGLLTVKGKECLEKADVVLFDRLINPLLLEWTKPNCEHVYCGKLPKRHLLRQEVINERLVEYAKAGKVVVRLKGGDPSVFGRVGEEAAALEQEHIGYEIIPGITAGIGAATYAGVSVTHRDHGASFAMVTGHDKSDKGEPLIDWKALATGIDTIAFYMGVKNLAYISQQLVKHGKSSDTPVLVIQWGTLGAQKTVSGTLETIQDRVSEAKVTNPAITLVGEVASLRTGPSWFEQKALFGEQIVLGRTSSDESEIGSQLRQVGAEVFEFPRYTTERYAIPSTELVKAQQILFLSPQSVKSFFQTLKEHQLDIRQCQATFYTVSHKSKKMVEEHGCHSRSANDVSLSEDLLIVGEEKWADKQTELVNRWGEHQLIISHREVLVSQSLSTCERLFDEDRLKTIVFPNADSVRTVTESFAKMGRTAFEHAKDMSVICFGPASYEAARQAGYQVGAVLESPSAKALIEQLIYRKKKEGEKV